MKILMLVNWKVEFSKEAPSSKQPPDYYAEGEAYWFFRYFASAPQVDVVDITSFSWIEGFEKEKLRFYVIQALRALPRLSRYDLILSHGMQSGVVISLFRRLLPFRTKHIVFDIGSFNSAAESGMSLRLMQYASKSIDGLIYHTGTQLDYYKKYFPWIVPESTFIPFGTDSVFFRAGERGKGKKGKKTILCVGYAKRDWDTLYQAYVLLRKSEEITDEIREELVLKFIGIKDGLAGETGGESRGIEYLPYIPVDQLTEEISSAFFCVLPLREFNYSYGQMTLLQQMALGKAVIASRVSSMLDYVEDGETALFYEPENPLDLRDKMLMLIRDGRLRKKLGEQGRAAVEKDYNEKNMAEKIEAFIEHILNRDRE